MNKSRRSILLWLLASVMIPLLIYACLQLTPARNLMWKVPTFHFYVITATLIAATASSVAIGWVGVRLRNVHVLLLSLALMSLSGFFMIHGLATPGFIIKTENHLPAVASQIAVSSCAVWMVLSALPTDNAIIRFISHFRRQFVVSWLAFILVVNLVSLAFPHIADLISIDERPLSALVGVGTIVLFGLAAYRYFTQYRFARFPLQLAVVFGAVWLCVTEVIMVTSMMWSIAWWLYHVILIASTCVILYGVIAQYQSAGSLSKTLYRMFSNDPLERIRTGISPSVQKLIAATEAKDEYTAGHNLRVAMYALQLADEMKIAPELRRALAQGGVIHDVGKIQVPSEILNKPGLLTPDERRVVERHPVVGYEMCKQIGFMQEELGVVRFHHEKWDGTGYPDKLSGEEIPVLARILAVADVYDALTSHRSYRQPWTHERALKTIQDGAGTHFDPACVEAWSRISTAGKLIVPQDVKQSS